MAMPLVRGSLGNPAPDAAPAMAPAGTPAPGAPADVDAPYDGSDTVTEGLARYVRDAYEAARDFRQRSGTDETLLSALRAVRGAYDSVKLQDIQQMGGSDVYLRITANKVRGVAAALRDVYASNARPWGIEPTANPEMPTDPTVEALIQTIIQQEVQQAVLDAQASGVPTTQSLTPQAIYDRRRALRDMLYQHVAQDATTALRQREDKMDDILQEGGFYNALWEFLLDIPTFPYAVLKGPVVYYKNQLHWESGKPVVKNEPTMTWERCSPFDVFFAPWSQRAQDGFIVHKQRATRASLQALIGLPSYNEDAIKEILERDCDSYKEWWSYTENDRADMEMRDSDINSVTRTDAVDRPIPMLEFHGPVSGQLLIDWGMAADSVPDSTKDLDITCWLIHDTVIGVRINPHPMGRKPFYVDSFERVPGSIFGLGVPKMIEDIQDVGNATLRALVNNMAISSGPQVVVNEGRIDPAEDSVKMYPWKVWQATDDQFGTGNTKPVDFFQPNSNAAELLAVLGKFMDLADTFSSLPQYMQGNAQGMSTIGRTSSGLSMLMDAANRVLKQSVTSIDKNIIEPCIEDLNIFLAMLRPDIVDDGDINVVAKGATELVQREQLRMRRLEFLQVTANPIDAQIVGTQGRASIIKEIARDLKLPTDTVVTGGGSAPMPATPGQPGQPGVAGAPGQQGQAGAPQGAMAGAPPPAAVPSPGATPNPTAGMAAPPRV